MTMEPVASENVDIFKDLRLFIGGAHRTVKCNDLELARIALSLLKTLPHCRDAVLEYLCIVFDSAVKKYITQVEKDKLINASVPLSMQEDVVINEIHGVVCSFVSSSPQAWAPIISSWSLQLLGQLSSRYNRLPPSVSLNETLHWWMSCKAARTLVDITTQCLHCLIDTNTEACVSALLDTSVAHSPHFDWVVAHVGSCFSKTVITRVLSLGLKDFSSGNGLVSKSSKLKSVVGILGHLGTSHFADIRIALLQLFQWSLEPDGKDFHQKQAVVPYLLQLASKSQTLLTALSTDVLQTLTLATLYQLSDIAPSWASYFLGETEELEDLIVSLALGCDHGGSKIISLLLSGCSGSRLNVAMTCQVIVELLLEELDIQVRSNKTANVRLLDSFKAELGQIQYLLLSENEVTQKYIVRLFRLMGGVNENVTIEAVSYVLRRGSGKSHLSTLLSLLGLNCSSPLGMRDLLKLSLALALRDPVENLWINLAFLLKYECKYCNGALSDYVVSKAVVENLGFISDIAESQISSAIYHAIMVVLDLLPSSNLSSLPLQLTLRLTRSVAKYFFLSSSEKDSSAKTVYCRRVNNLFTKLCSTSTVARSLALRQLLESALFMPPSYLFGSRRRSLQRVADQTYSLSDQNYKLGARGLITGRLSSAFRNSVVNCNEDGNSCSLTNEMIEENITHLLEAIRCCCLVKLPLNPDGLNLSLEAMIQTALLLVELISPDVMYNGLPWPEEDFCKVTVERDIHIRKIFDEIPVTWNLLELLARQQPSLCYCSVLLRALMASLISQWSSSSFTNISTVLETTLRILRLMGLGQLLPSPLTCLPDIIPHLTSQEVVMLLRSCVWNYVRDNVPSPALFSLDPRSGLMWRDSSSVKPSPVYTEPMRLVMLSNIKHFGDLYLRLFVRN